MYYIKFAEKEGKKYYFLESFDKFTKKTQSMYIKKWLAVRLHCEFGIEMYQFKDGQRVKLACEGDVNEIKEKESEK